MPRPKLDPEELKRRKRERDAAYKKRTYIPKPKLLLSPEERLKRKRERDRKYNVKRHKEKKSTYIRLSESRRRMRRCRHIINKDTVCGQHASPRSYYFCGTHKKLYQWQDDPTLYGFKMPTSSPAY